MPNLLKSFYNWFVKVDAPTKRVYNTGWDEHPTLTWEPAPSIEFGGGGMGWNRLLHPAGTLTTPQRKYFCECGTELTDGPTGGAAINAVCEKCRLNYGCLPGYGL